MPVFSKSASHILPDPPFTIDNSLHLKTTDIDYNQDGFQDLFIVYSRLDPYYAGVGFQLLINNGIGEFEDKTQDLMINDPSHDEPVETLNWTDNYEFHDLNDNGRLDLIGVDSKAAVRIWLQNDQGQLVELPYTWSLDEVMYMNLAGWNMLSDGRLETVIMQQEWVPGVTAKWYNRVWFSHIRFNRPLESLAEEINVLKLSTTKFKPSGIIVSGVSPSVP